jgi:two-component system copper resistance phosphate regulon response regulator CusR
MRVLVVEDSERLQNALARGLRSAGLTVDTAGDGPSALEYLRSYPYDVVTLDLMIPKLSGWDVLAKLRANANSARVLVLSARDQVVDRVGALNLGADDYLVKPFAFEELKARVFALARRQTGSTTPVLSLGEVSIDTGARLALVSGQSLPLSPKEYALLETLVRNRGQCLSRTALFEKLYDSTAKSSDRVIEVIVSTLRSKLARAGCRELIETRRGFGYCVP